MGQSISLQRLFDAPDRRACDLAELDAQPNSPIFMPTAEAYGEWQRAFSFFNECLFSNALPNCVITYTRRRTVLGYFCAGAFANEDGVSAHEIAMNPRWFAARGEIDTYSTLVHEMCHLWRCVCGGLNRKKRRDAPGYHSAVWAGRMEALGLVPSDTGAPGGKRTGYRVSHYILDGGPFDQACRRFLGSRHRINWRDGRPALRAAGPAVDGASPASVTITPPRNTRTRFVCPGCDLKAWARASAGLACTGCGRPLLPR